MNTISATRFKEGMRLLTGSVTIVTTNGSAGKGGLTATAVCSVSDAPPTLLVCVNLDNALHQTMETNGAFTVNILHTQHEALANRFAGFIEGVSMEDRLLEGTWHYGATHTPILADSLASFECRWKHALSEGSHRVIFGEIVEVHTPANASADPLLYFDRAYHHLQ